MLKKRIRIAMFVYFAIVVALCIAASLTTKSEAEELPKDSLLLSLGDQPVAEQPFVYQFSFTIGEQEISPIEKFLNLTDDVVTQEEQNSIPKDVKWVPPVGTKTYIIGDIPIGMDLPGKEFIPAVVLENMYPEEPEEEEEPEELAIDEQEDINLLARLIQTEAGGITGAESLREKAAVGLSVLYRIDDKKYPDTVTENVYMSGQYASPASSYSDSCKEAAEWAYISWKNGTPEEILPKGMIYFNGDGAHNHFHNRQGEYYHFDGSGSAQPSNTQSVQQATVTVIAEPAAEPASQAIVTENPDADIVEISVPQDILEN